MTILQLILLLQLSISFLLATMTFEVQMWDTP
jgi:hypothetical protein